MQASLVLRIRCSGRSFPCACSPSWHPHWRAQRVSQTPCFSAGGLCGCDSPPTCLCVSYLSQCSFFFMSSARQSIQLPFRAFSETVAVWVVVFAVCLLEEANLGPSYSAILTPPLLLFLQIFFSASSLYSLFGTLMTQGATKVGV